MAGHEGCGQPVPGLHEALQLLGDQLDLLGTAVAQVPQQARLDDLTVALLHQQQVKGHLQHVSKALKWMLTDEGKVLMAWHAAVLFGQEDSVVLQGYGQHIRGQ